MSLGLRLNESKSLDLTLLIWGESVTTGGRVMAGMSGSHAKGYEIRSPVLSRWESIGDV